MSKLANRRYEVRQGYETWTQVKDIESGVNVRADMCRVYFSDALSVICPNKFWYAAPEGVLKLSDIPSYAGLIEISQKDELTGPNLKIVKKAPFIHKRKIEAQSLLFEKYVWTSINLSRKVNELKRALKRMTEIKEKA